MTAPTVAASTADGELTITPAGDPDPERPSLREGPWAHVIAEADLGAEVARRWGW